MQFSFGNNASPIPKKCTRVPLNIDPFCVKNGDISYVHEMSYFIPIWSFYIPHQFQGQEVKGQGHQAA